MAHVMPINRVKYYGEHSAVSDFKKLQLKGFANLTITMPPTMVPMLW